MVPVSDVTTSPAALEPKLMGTRMRKDGCLAVVSVLIQADSPSGERLKPFTQTMKELDPVQFCVHFLSFIELSIWRVKNRSLPVGTGRLETKGCRGRVGRGGREPVWGYPERSKMRSGLAEGWPGWEEVRPAS